MTVKFFSALAWLVVDFWFQESKGATLEFWQKNWHFVALFPALSLLALGISFASLPETKTSRDSIREELENAREVRLELQGQINVLKGELNAHAREAEGRQTRIELMIDRIYWAMASLVLLILGHFIGFIMYKLGLRKGS